MTTEYEMYDCSKTVAKQAKLLLLKSCLLNKVPAYVGHTNFLELLHLFGQAWLYITVTIKPR